MIESYPDHGFVIDFEESKNIFKKVRKCNDLEVKVLSFASLQFKERGDTHVDRIYPKETVKQENTTSDIRRNNESVGKSNKGARGNDLPNDKQKTVTDCVVN